MRLSADALRSAQTGDGYAWDAVWLLADPERAFRGYRSAPHPATLPPGIAYRSENNRCGPGEPFKGRLGVSTAVAGATGLATGATRAFKGISEPYDDGTYVHFLLAWKESSDSKVHVYHRKQTKSTGVWSDWAKLTASSGKFGDTRMTDPSNGRVQFVWCEVPGDDQVTSGLDYHTFRDATVCVVSDGTNVRIVDLKVVIAGGSELGDSDTGLAHANAIPPMVGNIGVEFDAYDWLDVKGSAATATGAATADWLSITVSAAPRTWTFVTAATIAGGDAADVTFDTESITYALYTDDQDFFQARQILLIAHASDSRFWKTVTVSFKWKPSSSGAYAFKAIDVKPMVLPTGVADYELIVLNLPDQLPEQADGLLMNGLKFTTTAATPANCTITVYGFGVGGVVPGGTKYGLARRSRTSHVMSPGVLAGLTGFGNEKGEARVENPGLLNLTDENDCNAVASSTVYTYAVLPAGVTLPLDSRVFYTPRVSVSNPHTGDLTTNAADYVCIYRKEPRDPDYFRVDRVAVGSYAAIGGWTYESGSASSTLTYTDVVQSGYRERADVLPDEANLPPPPFQAGASVGARSYYLQDFPAGTRVRITEQGQPLRCTDGVAQSSDRRAGFNVRIAREKGRAVAQTVSGDRSSEVYVFTDLSVWRVARSQDGLVMFDLSRESALGCSSGQSVCQMDSTLCWLDKNRELRHLGSQSLSRFKVSELDSVPDAYVGVLDSVYRRGRLYTTLVESGGTEPTQALVYNFHLGEFESKDTFSSTVEPEQWIEWRIGGADKIYYAGADGAIYEYEKAAQYTDAGQAVAWLVESREFANSDRPNWDPIGVRHMGVVCSDLSSGTVTTARVFTSPAQTLTGTISVDVSTAYAWKQDSKSGASGTESPGGEGNGARLRWSASLSAAFEAYGLVAETKDVQLGGHA